MTSVPDKLEAGKHKEIFNDQIAPKYLDKKFSHEKPKIVILCGQPGAGKGGLARAAEKEFARDAVVVDPDELREFHPNRRRFRSESPYTWATRTHPDASAWAKELLAKAAAERKNIILDKTLSNGQDSVELVKKLQEQGYEVEVRVVATHKLESALGVEKRFADSLDGKGYGRYVPKSVHDESYNNIPTTLNAIHEQTGVRIRIFSREGKELDGSPVNSRRPGKVLKDERNARMRDPKIREKLKKDYEDQLDWHNSPDRIKNNPRITSEAAEALLSAPEKLHAVKNLEKNLKTIENNLKTIAQEAGPRTGRAHSLSPG